MSFSVSCGGCGLEYSGRRPFAQPRNAAQPALPRAALGDRPLAAHRAALARRADYESQSLARLPRRARLLAALPPPLPRAADRRRSGRPRRAARSSSRRRTRSASSTTTACSASAASAGARSPAAAGAYVDAIARAARRAAAPRPRRRARSAAHAGRRRAADRRRRAAARSTASSSRRTPTRRSRCSRIRATTSARVLGGFDYTTNEAVLHTDCVVPAARAARARASWNYRLGDDGRPTVTYYLNRLQRLDADRDYCVTLNERRSREEHVLARFAYDAPALHASRRCARSAELPRARRRRARTWYAGAHLGNGFHEDGLASRRRARPRRSEWPGEVGALRRGR